MAWKLRHAEEEAFLEEVADDMLRAGRPGDVPAAIRDRPRLLPGNEAPFRAWLQLHAQRRGELGPMPLSLEDVRAFMDLTAVQTSARPGLLAGILACEAGWHEVQAERAAAERARERDVSRG